MAESKSPSDLGAHAAQRLVSLTEHVIAARTLAELGEHVLGDVAGMMGAGSVVLYVVDPRFSGPYFAQRGFRGESASEIESLWSESWESLSKRTRFPTMGELSTTSWSGLHPPTCIG